MSHLSRKFAHHLREFEPGDDPACRVIAAAAALSSYGRQMPHLEDHFTEAQPLEFADRRIVALIDGRVVGFMELVAGHVSNLFVDPGFQGRGVGTALIAEAERLIEGDITLSVFTVNTGARRLYERLGFRNEGVKIIPFAHSSAVVVRMRKVRVAVEAS